MPDLMKLYDPFREMDELMRGLVLKPMLYGEPDMPGVKIDASEDEKAYTIAAEIPGVRKEDIQVSIDGNRVSISAEVKREKEEKRDERVIRSERYFGLVSRSFTLPQALDPSGARAKYENGVLQLSLPKASDARLKRISVS